MKIHWFGHSCFLIESSNGKKILIDPFDFNKNYTLFNKTVDTIILSHKCFNDKIPSNIKKKVINKTGTFNLNNIFIKGLPSYQDKIKGIKRGENIIFVFRIDNFKLCHLGSLGYVLSNEEINKIGNIDVLFIPVGGNFTIDGKEAADLCKNTKSKIIIPMNYNIHKLYYNIQGVEPFLNKMKNAEKISNSTLEITKNLTCINKVKILSQSNYYSILK